MTKSSLLLVFLLVIICGVYPLSLWLIGQTIFPFQANGSILVNSEGKPVGSKLIAQAFNKDEHFQARPSAASYDAAASASSSLAASNPILRDRVARSLSRIVKYQNGQILNLDNIPFDKWRHEHPGIVLLDVPADLVTTSASGLDPHITLQNAVYQLARVANTWATLLKRDEAEVRKKIETILIKNAKEPLAGLAGEKLINVLEVNLELHILFENEF